MKVLVLGATGMLGSAVFKVLSTLPGLEVYATMRSAGGQRFFAPALAERLIAGVDVENLDVLTATMAQVRPQVVVNCIGLVKQLSQANDPLQAIPINALLPHRLARLCALGEARLVHISTDCVFDGARGAYAETAPADATDLYGKSKYLGEVDYPHAITLRTSIIGHELHAAHSLIDWFLAQQGSCKGFTRAIFSGVPTVTLARIIGEVVLPRPQLHGLYHVAAAPISKFDLLQLVAQVYGKQIAIVPDDTLVLDRSLDAGRFLSATGYAPPAWPELIAAMHASR